MRRALAFTGFLLCACGPQVPKPGTQSNGSFTLSADGLCIDSRQGLIAAGTAKDLRLLIGSKTQGFSEPSTIDVTPNRPAEITGVSVSDDAARVYLGFTDGVAVIDPSKPSTSAVLKVVPFDAPIAQLYRDGATLFAVSFDNVVTALTVQQRDDPRVLGTVTLTGGTGTVRSATFLDHVATFSAEGAVWIVNTIGPQMTVVATDTLDHFTGWSARGAGYLFTGNTGALSVLAMPDDHTLTPSGPDAAAWRVPGNAPVLDGHRLYLFDDQRGTLSVVDVTNPTVPTLLTTLDPGPRVGCAHARAAMLDADAVLWVACAGGAVNYVIDY